MRKIDLPLVFEGKGNKNKKSSKGKMFGYQVLGFGSGGSALPITLQFLVIAGGGAGAGGTNDTAGGGGGGAGGYINSFASENSGATSTTASTVELVKNEVYTITVGGGGAGGNAGGSSDNRGGDSKIAGCGVCITSTGGGRGGPNNSAGAAGGDTNIGLELKTKGSGVIKAEDSGGNVSAVQIAGKETMWIPATAMYGPTTNPADAAQVETTATRPDLKVFDFDASTKQYTQFTVAMPKSWNEGTITYQTYWSPSTTNTGNAIFGLQAVACADNDTIDVAYGTAINITDAGIGTVEDQQITGESSAVTVAGSPAAGEQTYFQFFRDAADGSDTFTGECRVLGIKLFFTTDAANDL